MPAKKAVRTLAAIFAAALLTSCNKAMTENVYTGGFIAMDTYISATVYGEGGESAAKAAKEEILRLESLFSVTDDKSDVSKINGSDGNGTEVSGETAELIRFALEMCERSGGSLDITMYPVVREWGFTTGEYKIPDNNTLAKLLDKVNYNSVSVNGNTVTVPRGAMIDLGAAAKGYAGDRAIQILKEKGITSGLVNLGGNVQVLGGKPDGTDWSIGVQNPFEDGYICILNVRDTAVVTSGNYERYFEEDGVRYWHIIDPADGFPADNGIVSATVIGDGGAFCDALSTAIFVMGREKAEKLWREIGEFEMILVLENGEVIISEGVEEMIEGDSDRFEIVLR